METEDESGFAAQDKPEVVFLVLDLDTVSSVCHSSELKFS